jgi:hypothetical protein
VAKILKALATVAQKLRVTNAALTLARQTWQREHDAAHRAHAKAVKAQKEADKLRRQGKPKKAAAKDARAQNLLRKAQAAHLRAQAAVGQVKALTQRQAELEKTEADLIARKKELQGKVTINGNKATGGTKAKRIQAVALCSAAKCAAGRRHNFYSQAGTWDVDHCITGENYGHRSDCSSWFTSVFKSAGLPDPNGNDFRGGYTGTLGSHGKSISRTDAYHVPGAAVLFGTAPFHHVELALGDGTDHTIGHGSAPVDMGTFSLLPGPVQFRAY